MYLSLNDNGITIEALAKFAEGTIIGTNNLSLTAYGISIDSRTIHEGDAFVAITGDRFDGHDFVLNAARKGAAFAIVDHIPAGLQESSSAIPCIVVADTRIALGAIARGYKQLFRTISVAVTGSVGKTTTKEFIYSVLDTKYKTNQTKGNFNNEIGLPLTLLGLTAVHKALVVEMGMSAPGEIATLSKIAEPDISIITNIGTAHMEKLGSREGILAAKMEIIAGMKPGGILILNGDDPMLRDIYPERICPITVGIENENCLYNAENIRMFEDHMLFDIRLHDGDIMTDLRINVIGRHNIYNALFACAVGILLGVPEDKIRLGLLEFSPAAMRQNIIEKNGVTIIEDCYNANPESMRAALEVLRHTAEIRHLRPVAVLGDMKELGEVSVEAHREIGMRAAHTRVTKLVTFGEAARDIATGAIDAGMSPEDVVVIENTESPEEAAMALKGILREGDVILFKASRAIALERVIQLL